MNKIKNYFKGYYDVIKDKKFWLEIAKAIAIIILTTIVILWRIQQR